MSKSRKIGKISSETKATIPNPFEISTHKTERSGAAVVMHWMRDIIEQKNIDLGLPDVETGGKDNLFPDAIIYKSGRSKDVICVMEFKPPQWDPFNYDDPKEPARKKATARHAPYFVTSNFRDLILWNTERVNANRPEEEQIVARYHLSDIYDLDMLEDNRYKAPAKKELEKFLTELYQFSTGTKVEPLLAVDELLIYRLQEKIGKLAYYYKEIIYNEAHKEKGFAEKLSKWFNEQGWSFYVEDDNCYEQVSHQAAYLLANKIIFYNALRLKRPDKLSPLSIPEDLTHGGPLKGILQSYFNSVLEIDYETIYTTDFIDEIAFPDSKEVVEEIKSLVDVLKRYKLSELGFDVIGRIFERLIPEGERHKLGQYFTDPDIVDLILQFCVKSERDKVFDPSCGAGTFLVRAYQYKKLMNQMLTHEEILNTLLGNDIAKFPAHLSTINLAINDLSVEKNYPRIMQKDFFDLLASPDEGFRFPDDVRKVQLKTMSEEEFEIVHPRWFDAIVGNPPYTRQEEISEISGDEAYKGSLIDKALRYGNNKMANISKRAGIYAYFFVHGTKFLKDGGRFGFIVSNAWLDVEYGAGLQEFFLENYKIIAIVESKVERWFKDADINTVIVILEKCKEKEERDNNVVRFVYLLKPLRNFIPPAQTIWEKQIARKQSIDNLIKTILAHSEFYENDDLRIFTKKQSELWEEGFDPEEQKYVGSKWGKYLRAPEIFFKILEKGKGKLVPLKTVAQVRFGIKTGANEFFYLTEEEIKRRKIEKEFLQPIIFSLKEVEGYVVNKESLKNKVIICNESKEALEGTNLLKYIEVGERKGFNNRPTCNNRKYWYSLGEGWHYAPLIFPAKIGERMPVLLNHNVFEDKKLYGITPKKSSETLILASLLNSTLTRLFIEFTCRQLTGAQAIADVDVAVVEVLPIIDISKTPEDLKAKLIKRFMNLAKTESESIFKEIASSPEEVYLDKVKPDRRGLDKIVMGDILGLSDDEQLEVYRAVVDLVKSRIEKSKSVGKSHKVKKGIDIDAMLELITNKIGGKSLKKWYEEKILSRNDLETRELPEIGNNLKIEKGLYGWKVKGDKGSFQCSSESEAEYLKIWIEIGTKSIGIPKDEAYLSKVAAELKTLKKEIDDIIDSYLGSVLDTKLKSQILYRLWQGIS
jgi:adenine-specific DNA methylase